MTTSESDKLQPDQEAPETPVETASEQPRQDLSPVVSSIQDTQTNDSTKHSNLHNLLNKVKKEPETEKDTTPSTENPEQDNSDQDRDPNKVEPVYDRQAKLFSPDFDHIDQEPSPEDDFSDHEPEKWFLKINDDLIYGPMTISVLLDWVAVGRVTAASLVSEDKQTWDMAEDIPELKMDWVVEFDNGEKHGPFNLQVAPFLIHQDIIKSDTPLYHKDTGQHISVDTLLDSEDEIRVPKAETPEPEVEVKDDSEEQRQTDDPPPTSAKIDKLTKQLTKEKCKHEEVKLLLSRREQDYTRQIKDLNAKLEPQSAELERSKKDMLSLREEIHNLKDQLSNTQNASDSKENLLSDHIITLKNKLDPQSTELDSLKTDHNSLLEKHTALITQFSNANSTGKQKEIELNGIIESLKSKLTPLAKELSQFKADNQTINTKHATLTEEHRDLKDKSQILEANLREKINELTARLKPQSEQIESANADRTQLKSKLEKIQTLYNHVRDDATNKDERYARHISEIQERALAASEELANGKRQFANQKEQERIRHLKDLENQASVMEETVNHIESEASQTRERDRIQHIKDIDRVTLQAKEELENAQKDLNSLREQERIRYVKELDKQARATAEIIQRTKSELNEHLSQRNAIDKTGKDQNVDLKNRLEESEKLSETLGTDLDNLRRELKTSTALRAEAESREAKMKSVFQERFKTLQDGSNDIEERMKSMINELDTQRTKYKDLREQAESNETILQQKLDNALQEKTLLEKAKSSLQKAHSELAVKVKDNDNDLPDRLENSNKEIETLNNELEQQKSKYKDLREKTEGNETILQQKLDNALKEKTLLEETKASLQKAHSELTAKVTDNDKELPDRLERSNKEIETLNSELEQQKDKYKDLINDLETMDSDFQEQIDSSQQESKTLAEELKKLKSQHADLLKSNSHKAESLQEELNKSKEKNASLAKEVDNHKSKHKTLKIDLENVDSSLQKEIKTLKDDNSIFIKDLEELRTKHRKLKDQASSTESNLNTALKETQAEKAELSDKLSQLQEMRKRDKDLLAAAMLKSVKSEKASGKQIQQMREMLDKASKEINNTKKNIAALKNEKKKPIPQEPAASPAPKETPPPAPKEQPIATSKDEWFIKLENLSVYGPAPLNDVYDWCTQFRIGPHHMISTDKKKWTPAQDIPELKMDWILQLKDGTSYGPLNIEAAKVMITENPSSHTGILFNRTTKKSTPVIQLIKPIDNIGRDSIYKASAKKAADNIVSDPQPEETTPKTNETSSTLPPSIPPKLVKQQLQKKMTSQEESA